LTILLIAYLAGRPIFLLDPVWIHQLNFSWLNLAVANPNSSAKVSAKDLANENPTISLDVPTQLKAVSY
jgi:hypothetical protein